MAEKSKLWYLKDFNIFEELSNVQMQHIDKLTSMAQLQKDQPIYFPSQPSTNIYFLKEGHVKLFQLSDDGREFILDILGPGEIFGELALTDEGRMQDFAAALDGALICTMKKNDFETMLRKNPEMNLRLTKWIGLRLRRFEEKVNDLVFKDAPKRIISFLLRYAEDFGKIKGGIVTIPTFLSHQEIAFLTATSRQSVTTVLNDLREKGIIEFNRRQLQVLSLSKLQSLAR